MCYKTSNPVLRALAIAVMLGVLAMSNSVTKAAVAPAEPDQTYSLPSDGYVTPVTFRSGQPGNVPTEDAETHSDGNLHSWMNAEEILFWEDYSFEAGEITTRVDPDLVTFLEVNFVSFPARKFSSMNEHNSIDSSSVLDHDRIKFLEDNVLLPQSSLVSPDRSTARISDPDYGYLNR